jgi:hypothetical protein
MLGIGCPDRHPLLLIPFPNAPAERTHPDTAPSRESGFVLCPLRDLAGRFASRPRWVVLGHPRFTRLLTPMPRNRSFTHLISIGVRSCDQLWAWTKPLTLGLSARGLRSWQMNISQA